MSCWSRITDFAHFAFDATPDKELERQMMSVTEPKSEREDWAYREITRLRHQIDQYGG